MKFSTLARTGVAVMAMLSGAAHAATETFNITWSGAAFGNGASAIGQITLDTSVIHVGSFARTPIASVQDLWVTVRNAGAGDGTFTIADFSDVDFTAPTALDLDRELIGQALGNGDFFGDPDGGAGGDFNLFGKPAAALHVPSGTGFFQMVPDEYGGNGIYPMRVTSIAPAATVPEAGVAAMMLAGLAGLVPMLRRRGRERTSAA